VTGGEVLKRDMDLVRDILLAMEAEPSGDFNGRLCFEGYTSDQIGFHVIIMIQAGLIEGFDVTTNDSFGPEVIPTQMTWAGYDFLDAYWDEGRWTKAKENFNNASGVTFDVAKEVLTSLMIKGVAQMLTPV